MKFSQTLLGVSETPSYLINFFYWHNDWLKVFLKMNHTEYRKEFEEGLDKTCRNYLLMYCFEVCEHKTKAELESIVKATNEVCVPTKEMDEEYYNEGFL